jgi:transposase-like protein
MIEVSINNPQAGITPMANRIIPIETKVNALTKCLALLNVEAVAKELNVAPNSIRNWFETKLLPGLPEVLGKEQPGPKPEAAPAVSMGSTEGKQAASTGKVDEDPDHCPFCQSGRIWKNGLYYVINWLVFLNLHWFSQSRVVIQRYRCAICGREIASLQRQRLAQARRQGWQFFKRFVAFSKFKLGISDRRTALLAAFAFGRAISTTFVNDVTHSAGQKAQATLKRIADCRQKVAKVLMGDETFPRILDWQSLRTKGHSLGVAICENGLIRGVKVVRHQARDLGALFKGVVGKGYQPQYFLSDFDVHFPKIVSQAIADILFLKDFVHALRIIGRYFDVAVRQVTIEVPKGTSLKERQKQLDLKRQLLRKRLKPVLALFFKAFQPGYEPVAFLYIEGALARLQDPHVVIQTESVCDLHKQLTKFFAKHRRTLEFQFEQKVLVGLLCTSNLLESKNSLFKIFARIAQSFQRSDT